MRVSQFLFAIVLCGSLSGIARAEPLPKFEDCPVSVQSKHAAVPRLQFADAQGRRYRTVIRDATNASVNFAGHHVLATWGCGSSCIMAAAIDVESGRVISLPFTISDWPMGVTEPLSFRANSCLLVVRGSRNENTERGTYYYSFDGKVFTLRASEKESRR
ncbi:hypothetical protein B0G81_3680 [Paraburkholderia sp. BL6665CI2N2]|uniref:hypothetical protein n=1 Tax=Paraburkholderia sp. BL6665CI2N2 TaxID=1938806 RepID=UPI001064EA82|nr:hypothetical protein [Paraburkholderia sp. BL6665CI2N2]TDY23322.1 hypothetical protein B0G81_3680 [Paraburkholderia sp. BL6665CI2N2]